jgi:hypothetical protein
MNEKLSFDPTIIPNNKLLDFFVAAFDLFASLAQLPVGLYKFLFTAICFEQFGFQLLVCLLTGEVVRFENRQLGQTLLRVAVFRFDETVLSFVAIQFPVEKEQKSAII